MNAAKASILSLEEAEKHLSDYSLPSVLKLLPKASDARKKLFGDSVSICSIVNARCGNCGENCAFCAQSSRSKAAIKTWPLLEPKEIFKAAEKAQEHGAARFGIVTSGRALNREKELSSLCEAVSLIASKLKIKPCASLGILKEAELRRLKDAGLVRYHHNLEAAPSFFPQVCTTRPFSAQTDTGRAAKAVGLELCSGGIFGLGESFRQRAELLAEIRALDADSAPLNFLNAIPGTLLESARKLEPLECLNIIAVARLFLPKTSVRVCGGREKNIRDLQSMIFAAGADSFMSGGYLVTPGRPPEADLQMLRDSGLLPASV